MKNLSLIQNVILFVMSSLFYIIRCAVKWAQEKRAQEKRARKKGTGKMGTGKKGTSEKLGKKAQKEKLFLFVNYFYYYLINI